MNYNNWVFWILFAIVFIPYWRLRHRQQNMLLLVVSYLFYGFWDYRFLFLILISTVIDFIGGAGAPGLEIPRHPRPRPLPPPARSAPGPCPHAHYPLLWNRLPRLAARAALRRRPRRLSPL